MSSLLPPSPSSLLTPSMPHALFLFSFERKNAERPAWAVFSPAEEARQVCVCSQQQQAGKRVLSNDRV